MDPIQRLLEETNHGHAHRHIAASDLAELQVQIEEHARGHGLDFFPTIFEVVDCDQLNAIAAYGGFPTRYPHWRFGMEYEQLSKGYQYGLQKIYELVINNNPCYAYLMKSNAITDQKLVMAHVYGHCDFFKNNAWFAHTDRKMMDQWRTTATGFAATWIASAWKPSKSSSIAV